MGRPKSYQVEDVVSRALPVFWRSGYEGASLKGLEAATGLNKFSLYASFGSKRGLYLASLDLYVARYLAPYFGDFRPVGPESMETFLCGVVTNLEATGGLGCALLNGGIEFQGRDEELNRRIAETYEVLTATLTDYWKDRRRAEAFTALVRGLMVSGRMGLPRQVLDSVVQGSRALWAS